MTLELPLVDWTDDASRHPSVLWWSRLDGRFLVEARAIPAGRALLLVFDMAHGAAPVGRVVIATRGNPRYGPDPDDVDDFCARAIAIVDAK